MQKLDKLEAAKILDSIFEECGEEPNSVPMSELESYSNYRKESFRLQRFTLELALLVFLLLPLFFINPSFDVGYRAKGERGLPEYTINISTKLPIKRVTAVMDNHSFPVYEVNGHTYTVEPTKNGKMRLMVELFSGQSVTKDCEVSGADTEAPRLVKTETIDGKCHIYVSDEISGVDYAAVYATVEGTDIKPESYDSSSGCIIFGRELQDATVYIQDNMGNPLILKM